MKPTSQDYVDLLPSQFQKPKARAWVAALVKPFVDVIDATYSMNESFLPDTAVGAQLDIVGKLLGVSRQLDFTPSSGISSILDDDMYRLVIKAKVLFNQWDGTIQGFKDIWSVFSSDMDFSFMLSDGEDMSCTISIFSDSLGSLFIDLLNNGWIVPKTAGVQLNTFLVDPESIFGWAEAGYQPFDQRPFYVSPDTVILQVIWDGGTPETQDDEYEGIKDGGVP